MNTIVKLFCLIIILFSVRQEFLYSQNNDLVRRASIYPSIAKATAGQKVEFKIVKEAAIWKPSVLSSAVQIDHVRWSVNGEIGGNEKYGYISESGIYSIPKNKPFPHHVSIIGEVDGVQNSKLFATVILKPDEKSYETIFNYSEKVEDSNLFRSPHSLVLDINQNILIVDESINHTVKFSRDGNFIDFIGKGMGQNNGQFYRPRTILLDKTTSNLFISDQKDTGNRIQVFSDNGTFIRSFAPKGNKIGQFNRIHGMDFDSEGHLFVVDVDNSRITKLSKNGDYLLSWGESGNYANQLNEPHGLLIDPNDDVFVSSYYGTIKRFDSEGNFINSFAKANPPNGAVYIHAISTDRFGNIYCMARGIDGFGGKFEKSRDRIFSIEKYNNNGDFICGINLSVENHSEIWAIIDEEGKIYAVYRNELLAGYEILAPILK